jgi:hypothetical protein
MTTKILQEFWSKLEKFSSLNINKFDEILKHPIMKEICNEFNNLNLDDTCDVICNGGWRYWMQPYNVILFNQLPKETKMHVLKLGSYNYYCLFRRCFSYAKYLDFSEFDINDVDFLAEVIMMGSDICVDFNAFSSNIRIPLYNKLRFRLHHSLRNVIITQDIKDALVKKIQNN